MNDIDTIVKEFGWHFQVFKSEKKTGYFAVLTVCKTDGEAIRHAFNSKDKESEAIEAQFKCLPWFPISHSEKFVDAVEEVQKKLDTINEHQFDIWGKSVSMVCGLILNN